MSLHRCGSSTVLRNRLSSSSPSSSNSPAARQYRRKEQQQHDKKVPLFSDPYRSTSSWSTTTQFWVRVTPPCATGTTGNSRSIHSTGLCYYYSTLQHIVPRAMDDSSNVASSSSSSWEVVIAGACALLASVGMIVAFPSTTPAPSLCSSIISATQSAVVDTAGASEIDTIDRGGSGYSTTTATTTSPSPYATMALASLYHHPHTAATATGELKLEQPTTNSTTIKIRPSTTATATRDHQHDTTNHKPYDVSVRAIKGGRITMEDEYFVAEGGRFVAVFDGHGGGGVSQYLKHHLYNAVCSNLHNVDENHNNSDTSNNSTMEPVVNNNENNNNNNIRRNNTNGGGGDGPNKVSRRSKIPSVYSHATALKTAFAQMEETVLADDTLSYQGSTAVAVFLHEIPSSSSSSPATSSQEGTSQPQQCRRTLLSANVGDSRAVLSRHGRAVDLTRDHKPNDEREKARIMSMGGTIEWDRLSKVHRVRNLSLSRAIGDRFAKPIVSGEVEINHFPVMEDGDEFIMLASDGLWDAMTSEEAVSFVHQTMETELSSENIAKDDIENYKLVLRRNMAKFVAREAIRRGSCDNVCVVLVWLNDIDSTVEH